MTHQELKKREPFALPVTRRLIGRPPFTPSSEDEAALLLCTSDIERAFPTVLSDVISDEPMRTDSPMVISLRPDSDVPPINVATARAVPRAYEDEARVVTDMLLEKNVIIEVSTPTALCSPGFFVPKLLECLAIVWAICKCCYYLHGLQTFTVVTDHKPLVGVFSSSLE